MSTRDIQFYKNLAASMRAIETFANTPGNVSGMESAIEEIADCFEGGWKVLACGNGGSACDAMHFAEEFTGKFRKPRRALPVIPLTDAAFLTCVGNDFGFEDVFARGVEAYGKPGDVLVAISTSGNSENVIRAVTAAKRAGVRVVTLLGKDGGKLLGMGDFSILVPSESSERIQEVHMLVLHMIVEGVERRMFPENYGGDL